MITHLQGSVPKSRFKYSLLFNANFSNFVRGAIIKKRKIWEKFRKIFFLQKSPNFNLGIQGGGLNYFAIILQYYLNKKCPHFKFFPISVERGVLENQFFPKFKIVQIIILGG